VIGDGPGGDDLARFVAPLHQCAPQVLRGIKAQAVAARRGADWAEHRRVEQQHLVHTWLHADHWAAADKLLTKSS
jgi:hypothetical protein